MENMGINQLANMFMGNPQPLQQKVQQAQQQAKPGQIPPDLEAAIALQKIQEMRNAAMNQQAMQAGGPQPTVVDQLKQAVAPHPQMASQGLAQGMPQAMGHPAPHGLPQAMPQEAQQEAPPQEQSGLPQLPTSLGQHLAGGGIIAFAEGGDEGLDDRDKLRRMEAGYDPAMTEQLNAANVRPPSAMPAEVSTAARDILGRNVMTNPEQLERQRVANYESAVAAPDTSVYDRAAQELERRKQQFEAPKTGMPALMEYLQQVALAPKGVGSLTAGAMGAQKVSEMQQAREQQQFDLTKQILEQEQKKIETLRSYAKEKFNIGDAAFNQMFKANFEAAKQVTQNDIEAEKLAAQKTENELRRASEEKMTLMREAGATARHGAPTFADAQQEAMIKDYMDKHPESSRLDAMTEIFTAKQGSTPELKRAALVERLSEAWNKMSLMDKTNLANKGVDQQAWMKQQMDLILPSKSAEARPTPAGNTMTMADVQATAASSGKTVQEVIEMAKSKGFSIK
jgi:hypothetical protein